jgi:hypothetical protein
MLHVIYLFCKSPLGLVFESPLFKFPKTSPTTSVSGLLNFQLIYCGLPSPKMDCHMNFNGKGPKSGVHRKWYREKKTPGF